MSRALHPTVTMPACISGARIRARRRATSRGRSTMSGVYDTDAGTTDDDLDDEGATHGWIAFAWITLAVVGVFNFLEGILAITGASMYSGDADVVIGGLTFWGIVIVVLGNVQLVAAMCVLLRVAWGRWLG